MLLGLGDYLIRFQDRGIRILCWLALLAALGWTCRRYLIRPLRARLGQRRAGRAAGASLPRPGGPPDQQRRVPAAVGRRPGGRLGRAAPGGRRRDGGGHRTARFQRGVGPWSAAAGRLAGPGRRPGGGGPGGAEPRRLAHRPGPARQSAGQPGLAASHRRGRRRRWSRCASACFRRPTRAGRRRPPTENIRALVGTRLRIEGTASKPLRSAVLCFEGRRRGGRPGPRRPQLRRRRRRPDRRSWSRSRATIGSS